MKKYIFILIFIPLTAMCQSGISISGNSQFQIGQSIIPTTSGDFSELNYDSRQHQIKLSVFRGRKLSIGTFAINGSISYSINKIEYESSISGINDYEINKNMLIPSLELWYIFFQTENIFIYTSIGGYGLLQDLNILQFDEEIGLFEYNNIIPFWRTGLQLSYGRFFINPFLSFDLQGIKFNNFSDIFEADFEQQVKNYNIRSGLEFGIMF